MFALVAGRVEADSGMGQMGVPCPAYLPDVVYLRRCRLARAVARRRARDVASDSNYVYFPDASDVGIQLVSEYRLLHCAYFVHADPNEKATSMRIICCIPSLQ